MDDLMLPPLPPAAVDEHNLQGGRLLYTNHQMREYAKKAVEAERERLLDILKEMHMKTNGSHNYYLHAAVHLRKQLTR